MPPLAIDLFTGLHGWSEGLVAEGWRVVGFDLEDMCGQFGVVRSHGVQLVLQDVLTIHGAQFASADLIVASPPCQEYSYMAMPWSIAKQKAREYRDGTRDVRQLTALFDACFRIQREAIKASGRFIPLVVENVCGAQKWVGRARWHFGSFYLWGDVPALMPLTKKHAKVPTMGAGWYPPGHPKHVPGLAFNGHADRNLRATKNDGGSWFGIQDQREQKPRRDPRDTIANAQDGCKQRGSGHAWYRGEVGSKSSKSSARKAASAHIAKIPLPLSRWIARAWYPHDQAACESISGCAETRESPQR